MKTLIVTMLGLLSLPVYASGFRCAGENGYGVKATPRVLIVTKQKVGTVAHLNSSQFDSMEEAGLVIYEGVTNNAIDGRFIFVRLEVESEPFEETSHAAVLTLKADRRSSQFKMVCKSL